MVVFLLQQHVNQKAFELVIMDPDLVHDRKSLMDEAVKEAKKDYNYKRGYSRSGCRPGGTGIRVGEKQRTANIKQRKNMLVNLNKEHQRNEE